MASRNIGIVGGGVSGLHLGLLLRERGHRATIYSDCDAARVEGGPLQNTVAHHDCTRQRERELGINFWDEEFVDYSCHHHYFGFPDALRFRGDFERNSIAIDYRLYLPRLMKEFESRGGVMRIQRVDTGALGSLALEHDLVVVASGRNGMASLFAEIPEHTPFDGPQRLLCAGLYEGVRYSNPVGVTLSVSPGHGELIDIPMATFSGQVTALLFEIVPPGDLAELARFAADEDPVGFRTLLLDKLRDHYPDVHARIDPATFRLTRPNDLLRGSIKPSYRQWYTSLSDGTPIVAVGDAQSTVDPVTGQGGNVASFQAWTLGQLIDEQATYDAEFCQEYQRRAEPLVLAASRWTNATLLPPPDHILTLLGAMAEHKPLADVFTTNFNHPDAQWEIIQSPEAVSAFVSA